MDLSGRPPAWTVSTTGCRRFSTVANRKPLSPEFAQANALPASMSYLPSDTGCEYILLLKVFRPVCRRTFDLHLLLAHGDNRSDLQRRGLHNVLQATRSFHTSKQLRCSTRRPVNDSSIQRPRFYGLKAVVVLVCDIIQSSLPAPISISVSDIRSVLHSAARQ